MTDWRTNPLRGNVGSLVSSSALAAVEAKVPAAANVLAVDIHWRRLEGIYDTCRAELGSEVRPSAILAAFSLDSTEAMLEATNSAIESFAPVSYRANVQFVVSCF